MSRNALQITPKRVRPGTPPSGRLGVYVRGGSVLVGHVGPKATAVTAQRFGSHRAKLGKVSGRPAWLGMSLAECSSKGATTAKISPAKS
jgi:hypothetical protein